jgi:hypothetical protein
MTESRQDLKLEAYHAALRTRELEIKLFWQRSNYFLVLNTAIAVGFLSRDDNYGYAFGLSVVGVVVACLWVRINLGSKFWQSRWERRIELVEADLGISEMGLFAATWETVYRDVEQSLEYRPRSTVAGGRHKALAALQRRTDETYKRQVLKKYSVSRTMTGLSVFFVGVWVMVAVASGILALLK